MAWLLHIINILSAFPGFLFYKYVTENKIHPGWAKLMSLFPVVFVIIGNNIACYLLFGENFVYQWMGFITSFLLAYLALHYSKLYKEHKVHEQYTENLQVAKDYAEIETLKLQLHPHFLFNTLNTLNHLINPENVKARKYVQHLADVYRYILKNKSKELVLLSEELDFAEQYFYLLRIRYGQAIHFNIQTGSINQDDYLIIPISVQILIENAIKHNRFTAEAPLELLVDVDQEFVTVQNKVRGIHKSDSLKIGLNNLSERCQMITNKPLVIDASSSSFAVSIPLIKYK